MGVPGAPIAVMRVCQARVMMMIMIAVTRLQQCPRAIDTRARRNFEWQENLEEQRGERYPGRDCAPDPMARRRPVPSAVKVRAVHSGGTLRSFGVSLPGIAQRSQLK